MDGIELNDKNINGIVGGIDNSRSFEKTFALNATIKSNSDFCEGISGR
jgi:hypothetical protein